MFLGVGQPVGNIRVMFPASKDEISVLFSSKRKSLLLRFIIKHGQMLLYRSCSQKMCRMTRHYSSPTIKLGPHKIRKHFLWSFKRDFFTISLKNFQLIHYSKSPSFVQKSIFGEFMSQNVNFWHEIQPKITY